MLLVDCCHGSDINFELNESSGGRVKFKGKLQEADAVNKNKRMYPFKALDENVKKLEEVVKDRRLLGELDHPTDSIIHFEKASHVITKLWWEGNSLMGEGEILNTPNGQVLKALLNDGIKIGMSSRGVGNGKVNEDGILVIGDGYKLITFDAVADPSTFAAFQEKVVSNKTENVTPVQNNIESEYSTQKNESRSIHNVTKETLIACLGGIVKSQTDNIRSRLR